MGLTTMQRYCAACDVSRIVLENLNTIFSIIFVRFNNEHVNPLTECYSVHSIVYDDEYVLVYF